MNAGAFKKGEKRPKQGRPKGALGKKTIELKEMILSALDKAGGEKYLATQAKESPAAFLTLIGKVLPLQVAGTGPNGELLVSLIERRIIDPKGKS